MFALFAKDRFINRFINLIVKVILPIFIVLFSVTLIAEPASAAVPICSVDRVLTTADFSQTSGQSSNINLIEKVVQLDADPVGAEVQQSNGEIGFRFSPISNITARVRFSSVRAAGVLRGSSNIGFGSIKVDAVLRDLTDSVDLDSEEILNRSENGDIGETITTVINTILEDLPSPVFTEAFIGGHEYVALYRVEVRAQGFLGFSDFEGGNNGVFIGNVSIEPELEDKDGDGLYDNWEIDGVDLDCDSQNGIDLDLPSMGADPNHKDIFLEIDWMVGEAPTKATIQAVKNTFDAAPENTGGIENPDNQPGINFWVDTGNLTDTSASEDGAAPGTCGDGIDNNNDGLIDSNDPDCLVGDLAFSSLLGGSNLGAGNPILISFIPDLSEDTDGNGTSNFYEVKQNNFNDNRALVFHYAISAQKVGTLGGQAEKGGNDLIVFRLDESLFPAGANAGVLMHEFGHNLNLDHGGDEDKNQKPNYVSVMNYSHAFGIGQNSLVTSQDLNGDGVLDGRIIDYSPPRFPAGRGKAPLDSLDENDLDESIILDPSDPANQFAFYSAVNDKFVGSPLDQRVDWNGDGNTDDAELMLNINNDKDDMDVEIFDTLTGHNDWDKIALDFKPFGSSADFPINPEEPDDAEEWLRIYQELNTTDLEITKTDSPDPVAAGQELTYGFTIRNNGPNIARNVQVIDFLPSEVRLVSNTGNCSESQAGELTCNLGEIPVEASKSFEIKVHVAADLPCQDEQFTTITNSARVLNLAGADSNSRNNRVSESTQVLCIKFEYVAKLVCGKQNDRGDLRLTPGLYATAINVHNPNDEKIYFFKKLALTYPPEAQAPGRIIPIAIDTLEYDQALAVDCSDIRQEAFDDRFPEPYVKGFVVIQSPRSLDVTAVYTTASLGTWGKAAQHSSIDVEQIRERIREQPEKVELPDLIPLAPLPPPPFDEEFGVQLPEGTPGSLFCAINSPQGGASQSISVTVRNQGLATAGASITVADFFLIDEQVPIETPSLEPGEEVTLDFEVPQGCYNLGSCRFRLIVDAGDQVGVVTESNEDNNVVESLCLAPVG